MKIEHLSTFTSGMRPGSKNLLRFTSGTRLGSKNSLTFTSGLRFADGTLAFINEMGFDQVNSLDID